MKKITLILCLIAASAINAYCQTVDEVVANHLKAIGGEANWSSINTMKMSGSMELMPEMKAPFTIYMKDKKKVRFELEFQGMKMIQALDGDSGWAISPFMGKTEPERMSEEDVRGSQEMADFTPELFNYKSKGSVVELMGKEDMEGTESLKLKVTKKNGDVKYLFLDAQTFMLMKETSRQKFNDKEIFSASIPSDYRTVGGIMVAFSNEMRGEDEEAQGQSMVFDKVEVNPEIPDSLFAFPADAVKK